MAWWPVARSGEVSVGGGLPRVIYFDSSVLWPGLVGQYAACSWPGVELLLLLPDSQQATESGSGDTQARPDQVVESARVNFRVRRASLVGLGVASRACLCAALRPACDRRTCIR